MLSLFTNQFFVRNRQALRNKLPPDAIIVITANGLLQQTRDTPFPFKQESNFWYLTGLNEPDFVLVMTPSDEYLIVPTRDAVRTAFDGAIDSSTVMQRSGIVTILAERPAWQRIRTELSHTKVVYTCMPGSAYDKQHGLYLNPAQQRIVDRLRRQAAGTIFHNVRVELSQLRVQKQKVELDAIQAAIDITTDAIEQVKIKLDSYDSESQIEADLSHTFSWQGADGHAFSPIVACGKRATVLHNVANSGSVSAGQLLVMDIGAEVEHYAADITRTISIGPPTSRQSEVHAAVLDMQSYALGLLSPGLDYREYELAVHDRMGKTLQQLGLIKEVNFDNIRRYYPHGTSHFMGLDVHDVGNYHEPLTSGMVLTCEPGIYIPEEGIGIRIEDDVLITDQGNTVLSQACPRQLI